MMGPRVLLPFDVAALVVAFVGAWSLATPLVALFVAGMIAGALVALTCAWRAMTPMFRQLVRASVRARLAEHSR